MLKNYQELDNEINMLEGNINRMCITDNIKELTEMYNWAKNRIFKIYQYNKYKIKSNKK